MLLALSFLEHMLGKELFDRIVDKTHLAFGEADGSASALGRAGAEVLVFSNDSDAAGLFAVGQVGKLLLRSDGVVVQLFGTAIARSELMTAYGIDPIHGATDAAMHIILAANAAIGSDVRRSGIFRVGARAATAAAARVAKVVFRPGVEAPGFEDVAVLFVRELSLPNKATAGALALIHRVKAAYHAAPVALSRGGAAPVVRPAVEREVAAYLAAGAHAANYAFASALAAKEGLCEDWISGKTNYRGDAAQAPVPDAALLATYEKVADKLDALFAPGAPGAAEDRVCAVTLRAAARAALAGARPADWPADDAQRRAHAAELTRALCAALTRLSRARGGFSLATGAVPALDGWLAARTGPARGCGAPRGDARRRLAATLSALAMGRLAEVELKTVGPEVILPKSAAAALLPFVPDEVTEEPRFRAAAAAAAAAAVVDMALDTAAAPSAPFKEITLAIGWLHDEQMVSFARVLWKNRSLMETLVMRGLSPLLNAVGAAKGDTLLIGTVPVVAGTGAERLELRAAVCRGGDDAALAAARAHFSLGALLADRVRALVASIEAEEAEAEEEEEVNEEVEEEEEEAHEHEGTIDEVFCAVAGALGDGAALAARLMSDEVE
jgi:hypothetical protein